MEDVQETKTYEFGDPFRLNIPRTILNAVERSGPGIPVNMSPEDLEIYKPEHQTRSATVLAAGPEPVDGYERGLLRG